MQSGTCAPAHAARDRNHTENRSLRLQSEQRFFMAWITRFIVRAVQSLASRDRRGPRHLALGRRGETEALFYLQKLGYKFVATNFRVPPNRGEIDLIGWDKDVLCFIEVKTRTDVSFAPPSTAVTTAKQQHIVAVARRYLRRLAGGRPAACRFDIVSIVPAPDESEPQIILRKGAFSWEAGGRRRSSYRDYSAHGFRDYRRR